MMTILRKTILAYPKQVAELKATLNHPDQNTRTFEMQCLKYSSIKEIVENALTVRLGNSEYEFRFPEKRCQPPDRISDYEQSIRYFIGNAITNVHLTKHTQRCFKKGPECYANLPDGVSESYTLVYNKEYDLWSNWCGMKEPRFMIRFQPKRLIEDVFMNVHNPVITKLLLCNNNVQIGMNGRSVLYSTGYQVKSQQKEERAAFEKVSNVLCKVIQKQVNTAYEKAKTVTRKSISNTKHSQAEAEEAIPEHQLGFRRILAGIYTHTSGHILGAPMAHYNAMNESRFTFSHNDVYLPVYALGNGTVHTVYRLCWNRHKYGTPPSCVTFRHSLQRCAVISSALFCYDIQLLKVICPHILFLNVDSTFLPIAAHHLTLVNNA